MDYAPANPFSSTSYICSSLRSPTKILLQNTCRTSNFHLQGIRVSAPFRITVHLSKVLYLRRHRSLRSPQSLDIARAHSQWASQAHARTQQCLYFGIYISGTPRRTTDPTLHPVDNLHNGCRKASWDKFVLLRQDSRVMCVHCRC